MSKIVNNPLFYGLCGILFGIFLVLGIMLIISLFN